MHNAAMRQIQRLDHQQPAMAAQIQHLLEAAHAQESARIGVTAALGQGAAQIQASSGLHLGLLEGDALLGVVVVGADEEAGQLAIQWLAVASAHQRQGIASLLVERVLSGGAAPVAVTVVQANAGALALYRGLGFKPYRRGVLGEQGIEVVKLRRLPF